MNENKNMQSGENVAKKRYRTPVVQVYGHIHAMTKSNAGVNAADGMTGLNMQKTS